MKRLGLWLAGAGLLWKIQTSPAPQRSPQLPQRSLAAFAPSEARVLSAGSPTKDEDPMVIRSRDGRMFVVWFSDRGGNADIYLTSTDNGTDWIAPIRITTSRDGDFAPNLYQDDAGVFHLVWFRRFALNRGNIWYNSSTDGFTWSPSREVQVTLEPNVDDWVPAITGRRDGDLLVYFVSEARAAGPARTHDIFAARRRQGESRWDRPLHVDGISSPTEHDHLPFAARTGDRVSLVWSRYGGAQALPWLAPRSDLMFASSPDGLTWDTSLNVTREAADAVNLFATLVSNSFGEWSMLWLSTRFGQRVVQTPLALRNIYPEGARDAADLDAGGYSHRLAPTSAPGVYLAAWVAGPDGAQDVYYRFVRADE